MTTSSNPDEIRAEIERTRYELSQDVDALAEKVSPTKAVSRQTNRMREGFISVKENIMGTPEHHAGPSAGQRARYAAEDARGTAREVADQARGYVDEAGERVGEWAEDAQHALQQAPAQLRGRTAGNPLAAGLIALGAGWLIGSMIPSSEAEQRAAARVKDEAAPLVDEAKQVAQQVREELEPIARDAAESVKATASEAVDNVKAEGTDKAKGLTDESKQAAQRVKDTAQES